MLTRKQADSAAKALLMRPANRGNMLACPACGAACVPAIQRHKLSPFGTIRRLPLVKD